MAIAGGRKRRPLDALARGARCTWFAAQGDPRAAFKRWLGAPLKVEGALVVDADAIAVQGPDGKESARGLATYGAEEARRIMGRNSGDIETVLGYRGREEIIHRDDMALTQNVSTEEDTP
jgi:glutamate 5-kinase